MATLRLKQKLLGRRRFIKGSNLEQPLYWQREALILREQIRLSSHYQIVSETTAILWDLDLDQFNVLIEVLGIPSGGLDYIDLPEEEIIAWELEESAYNLPMNELLEKIRGTRAKLPKKVDSKVHIVIDREKIALHFFVQKDYSHLK